MSSVHGCFLERHSTTFTSQHCYCDFLIFSLNLLNVFYLLFLCQSDGIRHAQPMLLFSPAVSQWSRRVPHCIHFRCKSHSIVGACCRYFTTYSIYQAGKCRPRPNLVFNTSIVDRSAERNILTISTYATSSQLSLERDMDIRIDRYHEQLSLSSSWSTSGFCNDPSHPTPRILG